MGQMVGGQQINPSGAINNTLPQGTNMNNAPQQGTNTIMVQQNQGNWSQNPRFPQGHIANQQGQPGMPRMGTPQMQGGLGGEQQRPTKQSLDQLLLALKSPNTEEQVILKFSFISDGIIH